MVGRIRFKGKIVVSKTDKGNSCRKARIQGKLVVGRIGFMRKIVIGGIGFKEK